MRISIELPFFPGFYESDLENSDTSYWAIKEELEYYQDSYVLKEHPEYAHLTEDDLDFDYRSYESDMIDSFIEVFKSYAPEIVESVELDEMVSPKQYNFSTDRLFAFVELSEDWQDKVREFISENYDWLKEQVYKDWTSYDGFMSFMENDFDEWENYLFTEKDARYIATMIGYMMYRKNKNVRNDIIMSTLEGDVYPESYVFITPEAQARLADMIKSGVIKTPDPNQLEIPFEW